MIGWQSAIRGFLSKKWQTTAMFPMYDNTNHDQSMGNNTIIQIIKALYTLTC